MGKREMAGENCERCLRIGCRRLRAPGLIGAFSKHLNDSVRLRSKKCSSQLKRMVAGVYSTIPTMSMCSRIALISETFLAIGTLVVSAGAVFGQSARKPSFEVADVHVSAPKAGTPSAAPAMRGPLQQGVRWELKNGSMVDLIAFAYGVDSDKVLGGPSWLEFDRFDVIAKAAPNTPPEKLQAMLQSLLEDRFKLVFHSDTRPFPGFALSVGKSPKFKDSDGSGQPGCGRRMSGAASAPDAGGAPLVRNLVAACHNASMETFSRFVRGLISPRDGAPGIKIVDKTELKGTYDLEFGFSPGDSQAAILDAIDKQVGLKLEPILIPTQVILVDGANRRPTANAPEVATAFPPPPSEFDVASLKPSVPVDGGRGGGIGAGVYQHDRLTRQNVTLTQLINTAWNIYSPDLVVGLPKFADTDHYDLMAKIPESILTAEGGSRDQVDLDLYRPMYQKLLIDRFQMKVHFEDRPVNTWVLTAVKPKLQRANPADRTKWIEGPAPGENDPRKTNPALNRLVRCHNMTMAEFAALLPSITPGNQTSVVRDETGLEGSWDFNLTFSGFGFDINGAVFVARGADGAPASAASDPSGAISLRDAINKQLGLKLELQKRPTQVLVIDHIEPKPAEN
jgi:uncharacterized protein (TIGR03435 family)